MGWMLESLKPEHIEGEEVWKVIADFIRPAAPKI